MPALDYKDYDLIITDSSNDSNSEYFKKIGLPILWLDFVNNQKSSTFAMDEFFSNAMRQTLEQLIGNQYWHTDLKHKEAIYKFIAQVNHREDTDETVFVEKLMLRDHYLNAERKNMVVFITACDYEFYEPTLQILINKKPVLWNTIKSQFFLFYGYPKHSIEGMFIIDSLLKFISQMSIEELTALVNDEIDIREALLDKYQI
jgi:hypothetical protein